MLLGRGPQQRVSAVVQDPRVVGEVHLLRGHGGLQREVERLTGAADEDVDVRRLDLADDQSPADDRELLRFRDVGAVGDERGPDADGVQHHDGLRDEGGDPQDRHVLVGPVVDEGQVEGRAAEAGDDRELGGLLEVAPRHVVLFDRRWRQGVAHGGGGLLYGVRTLDVEVLGSCARGRTTVSTS